MGRDFYQHHMELRLRDLTLQIESVKAHLAESGDPRAMADLAGEIAALEARRDQMNGKLTVLEQEPDGTWEELKSEIEDEWDGLAQDFEERMASLI
jgi:predicted  nucleic acid-binding Zn-ribbon protein